jgi:uncharacterized protein YjiS (DUF1127 family)
MKHRPAGAGIDLKQPGRSFLIIGNRRTPRRNEMMEHLRSAIQRQQLRARHRRHYRALLDLEDHFLRDIGLTRDEVRGQLSSSRYV